MLCLVSTHTHNKKKDYMKSFKMERSLDCLENEHVYFTNFQKYIVYSIMGIHTYANYRQKINSRRKNLKKKWQSFNENVNKSL